MFLTWTIRIAAATSAALAAIGAASAAVIAAKITFQGGATPALTAYAYAYEVDSGRLRSEPIRGGRALAGRERVRLRNVIRGGPNFAGQVTALLSPCGSDCGRLLLVDWRSGKVVDAPALAGIDMTLPCRPREAVQLRSDSRLLSVTRMRRRSR